MASLIPHLKERIARRDYTVGIIGLGYVGLPAVLRFWEVGFRVLGFDIDPHKVKRLNAGESYIRHLPADRVASLSRSVGLKPPRTSPALRRPTRCSSASRHP
jgi:UDP-N-acetyl-D-mannosaminuronate dehydrogenase